MRLSPAALAILLTSCAPEGADVPEPGHDIQAFGGTFCDPQMWVFPVDDAHNIGYDHSSCGSGTCEISCPDVNANSDWGGDHHGVDVFAYQRAPLVAVADAQVVAVGTVSDSSGIRVRLRDACGWEYYYGHMDEAVVWNGQYVGAGELIGYMGYTGTYSTHLHFNVSPGGDYNNDIDPFYLLEATSYTACDGDSWEPEDDGSTESDGGGSDGGGSDGGGSDGGGSDGGSDGSTCGMVWGDTVFRSGEGLLSCDGRFTLLQQDDGNLVLYLNGGGALWHAGTHGNAGASTVMQDDGNLVVYSIYGQPLWYSGTAGHATAALAVQDDGNLVIYDWGVALWQSGTGWY
jgi:hypothetical protein